MMVANRVATSETRDGLAVERRAIGRDAILGQDAVMPDETCLVEGAALDRHDAADLLDAGLVEPRAVLAGPLADVLLQVEVAAAHSAFPLLRE